MVSEIDSAGPSSALPARSLAGRTTGLPQETYSALSACPLSARSRSNKCSMPNETWKSLTRQAIEQLIETVAPDERAELRVWILTRFEVDGRSKAKVC